MITYALQVGIYWIVFYALYHWGLRKETFHNYNRFYLIGSLILSLFIPYWATYQPISQLGQSVFTLDEIELLFNSDYNIVNPDEESSINWWNLLKVFYFLGFGIFSLRLVFGLFHIFSFYKSGRKERVDDVIFVRNKKRHLPFSFFNFIFLSDDYEIKGNVNQIIQHEIVHAHQRHSVDVLIAEVLQIVFWFNPVMILFKRAIKETHEYIADHSVVESGDVKLYSAMLLNHVNSRTRHAITNQFFQKQIKNRIMMMMKSKSNATMRFKYLLALPVLAGLTLFTACNNDAEVISPKSNVQERSNLKVTKEISADGEEKTIVEIPEKLNKNGVREFKDVVTDSKGKVMEVKLSPEAQKESGFIPVPPPPPPAPPKNALLKNTTVDGKEVFMRADEMPRFPGCEDSPKDIRDRCATKEMLKYFYTKVKYPAEARAAEKEGRVVVQFVVTDKGGVENVNILKDLGFGLGTEAARVVKSMNDMPQKWIPGKQGGKPVNVRYTLPVKFKIG